MNVRVLLRPRDAARRALVRCGDAIRRAGFGRLLELLLPPSDAYAAWRFHHDVREPDRDEIKRTIALLNDPPAFSVCMPVCDPPVRYLRAAVASVLDQLYPHWELRIADDACTDPEVIALLDALSADPRISIVRSTVRRGIAAATNAALDGARGDFVAFVDHDDLLAPHALYRFARVADADVDVIYSDEDKVGEDSEQRFDPYFKPDWSPETLLSKMYVGHLLAVRRSLAAGLGFRSAFDGSQDYDLMLRVAEVARRIVHVPDVLYHWRAHAGSTGGRAGSKPYAVDAAAAALRDALARRGERGDVEVVDALAGRYRVHFEPLRDEATAIIIPTRDGAAVLERCLESVFVKTADARFVVIVVDNGSVEPATFALFERWSAREPQRFRVLRDARPFNYSALNNAAVARSREPLLVFLNNDTQVVSPGWLRAMTGYAQRDAIGAVGALLLYPNGRVQHAGVTIGIGGLAGHLFKRSRPSSDAWFGALHCVTNYSAVTAACLMVRRETFERVGGFDESLPVAWNDVDFCLRLGAAGFRNVYLPHVRLLHHESFSRGLDDSPAKRARSAEEVTRLRERWAVAARPDPYYNRWLTLVREDGGIGP